MPRRCTICAHPKREEIEQEILNGVPYSAIARRFNVGRDSVRRHAKSHLPKRLAAAHKAEEAARGDDLLAKARGYQHKAEQLLLKAEAEGDYGTALRGIKEARSSLQVLMHMREQMIEGESAAAARAFLTSPEWIELKQAITRALTPYPEAKRAVWLALKKGGDQHA